MPIDPSSLIGKVVERAALKVGGAPAPPPAIDASGEEMLVDQLASQLVSFLSGTPGAAAITGGVDDQSGQLERSVALARALGACDCWGELPGCRICRGHGRPGWTLPDRPLFERYVRPALRAIREHQAALHNGGGARLHTRGESDGHARLDGGYRRSR